MFDIRTVTMFCLAMRRDVFERIGPLDQRFEIGMLEDDDYSMRARQAGYRLVCAEDCLRPPLRRDVVRQARPRRPTTARSWRRTSERFEEKWGEPWQPYERRAKPEYEQMRRRIREIVAEALPSGATVLVVSRGDEQLLLLEAPRARHFPEAADGSWAGHHPADSGEAVAQLEAMRESGGQFLVLPEHRPVVARPLPGPSASTSRAVTPRSCATSDVPA